MGETPPPISHKINEFFCHIFLVDNDFDCDDLEHLPAATPSGASSKTRQNSGSSPRSAAATFLIIMIGLKRKDDCDQKNIRSRLGLSNSWVVPKNLLEGNVLAGWMMSMTLLKRNGL